jgi:hypothetical protein
VLAGTYNQSFALNGKNVVVRGAPGNATILNGAKLTTSIARFTGNEPATAGLENLVFRNGTVGQPINPPSYNFTGGGGVFGKDSSAFIKNCRFEDCGADFGAGGDGYGADAVGARGGYSAYGGADPYGSEYGAGLEAYGQDTDQDTDLYGDGLGRDPHLGRDPSLAHGSAALHNAASSHLGTGVLDGYADGDDVGDDDYDFDQDDDDGQYEYGRGQY